MTRRKKNINDTLFQLLFVLACLMYFYTRNIYLILGIIISITVLLLLFLVLKNIKIKEKYLKSGINIVDRMSGEEFERFLLAHFEKLGYKVDTTPASNDYGADLVMKKGGQTTVVQAKRWTNKVGIEAVQQIIGAKSYYNAQYCMVITNNYFTPNAINLAGSSNVDLWDRQKLLHIMSINNRRELAESSVSSIDTVNENNSVCPMCGAKLILKHGKYGSFYGCSNYPKCRYTKDIE